ncbi:hypothetical protein GGE08_002283 [Muricauda sp. ARW1Y1]|nr:hypothetical protein [Muricauda sp. ARW1Y1]
MSFWALAGLSAISPLRTPRFRKPKKSSVVAFLVNET